MDFDAAGVYGDLTIIYPEPSSLYFRGTIGVFDDGGLIGPEPCSSDTVAVNPEV